MDLPPGGSGQSSMSEEKKNKALSIAVRSGDVGNVRRLLDDGARVDQRVDYWGCRRTLLHIAARRGDVSVMELLLEKGADINAGDDDGYTPLYSAAIDRAKEAVNCLLDQGCNVKTRNSSGRTPLHRAAAWSGWTEVIARIVERGGVVNSTDNYGNTPLYYAALNGNLDAAEWLLKHGARVQPVNNYQKTPLHVAVLKHRTDTVKLLQRYGAEVTLHPKITLHDAIRSDCIQLGLLLVEAVADVNAKSGRLKDTPLHRAVRHDSLDIVEELIGRGCDVNAADRKGNTPLHVAALHDRHGLMKTLVEAGGNVNSQGERDRTPLHVVVCKKKRAGVSALLELNADTECVDGDGKTARDLGPTKAITKLLSDQSTGGCNPSIPTNEQPLVIRKRRHDESIESPSSKTRQLCHPTVFNEPASSDQPTTEQLLHLQSGTVEEDAFNPRTDNAPDAAQIQTSSDLSNTYFKGPYITSITPVGVNTSHVTSPSQPMMSLLNNTSDYIFSPSDINTSSVTSPSATQMSLSNKTSGEHSPSVVRDEIRLTTSYEQAEASHLVNTLQSSAKSQQNMHGNATYITNTASSIQRPEDTSDTSNLGSMAHSFATHKPTTLTSEKGNVSSSIDLQDDDNNNDWDPFERSSEMHLINSQGKAANMDGIQFPPDQVTTHSTEQVQDQIPTHSRQMAPDQLPTHSGQIAPDQVPTHSGQMAPDQVPTHSRQMTSDQVPTHSGQLAQDQVPTHIRQMAPDQVPTHFMQMAQDQIPTNSGQLTQDLFQMHTQPTSDTNRVRLPRLQVASELYKIPSHSTHMAQPGQLAPVQGPPPYRLGKTESTIQPLQPDSCHHLVELTQLSVQFRQLAEQVTLLQDEVVSLKAAKQTPSNQSQAQCRQQTEEIRRLKDEVVSLKAATKPTSNQCQSEVGQLPDTNRIPQPSSRPTPADSPTPEAPVVPPQYESTLNPDNNEHEQPIRYLILPAGQSASQEYEKLAKGRACNVFVLSDWMDDIRRLGKYKSPSYKLKQMVDGLYERKELYEKKASSILNSTDLGKALRSYAIDVLKMEPSQVTAALNSKITTVKRRCKKDEQSRDKATGT